MVEDAKEERIKRMEELGKWGVAFAAPAKATEIKPAVTGVPKEIREARKEQVIWCKNCYAELPATSMKDFVCPVCGHREYSTSRPF